jgi:hypothetical protein
VIGGFFGLLGCIAVIANVTVKYRRVQAAPLNALTGENFDFQRMVDQVNVTATQCSFVAGNVFFGS